eukprot:UN19367
MALPISKQPPLIELCFEQGKHVLSEKAIAADYDVGAKLLKLNDKYSKKVLWLVAENWRTEGGFWCLKNYIDKSNVKTFKVNINQPGEGQENNRYYKTKWRHETTNGGHLIEP